MDEKTKNAPAKTGDQAARFVVGNSRAMYVHGKSTRPMPTLTLQSAIAACQYLSKLDYGTFEVYELVSVLVEANGSLTRQT